MNATVTYLGHGVEIEVINSCYSGSKDPQAQVKVSLSVDQMLLESNFLKQHNVEKEHSQCLDLISTHAKKKNDRTHESLMYR